MKEHPRTRFLRESMKAYQAQEETWLRVLRQFIPLTKAKPVMTGLLHSVVESGYFLYGHEFGKGVIESLLPLPLNVPLFVNEHDQPSEWTSGSIDALLWKEEGREIATPHPLFFGLRHYAHIFHSDLMPNRVDITIREERLDEITFGGLAGEGDFVGLRVALLAFTDAFARQTNRSYTVEKNGQALTELNPNTAKEVITKVKFDGTYNDTVLDIDREAFTKKRRSLIGPAGEDYGTGAALEVTNSLAQYETSLRFC